MRGVCERVAIGVVSTILMLANVGRSAWQDRGQVAYIAVFCEAFGASYGDISIVVSTSFLGGDVPLLSEHDDDNDVGDQGDGVLLVVSMLADIMRVAKPGNSCKSP